LTTIAPFFHLPGESAMEWPASAFSIKSSNSAAGSSHRHRNAKTQRSLLVALSPQPLSFAAVRIGLGFAGSQTPGAENDEAHADDPTNYDGPRSCSRQ
jgi:hypothetical protein